MGGALRSVDVVLRFEVEVLGCAVMLPGVEGVVDCEDERWDFEARLRKSPILI